MNRRWWSLVETVLWLLTIPPTFIFLNEAQLLKWVTAVTLYTAARTALAGYQADTENPD